MKKYNFLKLLSFLVFFSLVSCAKEEKKVEEVKEVSVKSTIDDFGGVILGNEKNTAITIVNNSTAPISIPQTVSSPFSITSLSQSCLGFSLQVGQTCIFSVRFKPTEEGIFETSITFGDKTIALKGVGLEGGYMFIDDKEWEIGTVVAGQKRIKKFTITNFGDLSITSPTFNLPSFMEVGLNRCGVFIQSKGSCEVTLEANLTIAGEHSNSLTINSIDGGILEVNYNANVTPNQPSGLIAFESTPLKMDSAGEEFHFETKPIKDSFGNVVNEGTPVFLSVNQNLLSLDGNQFITNEEGRINFRVRTRTIKGEGTVSITSNQASGYYSFNITAGDAFGTIPFQTFINNIPANGMSQTSIRTEIIFDQYNNMIEDGTEVIFEVIGNATVSGGANPKIRKTVAIGGQAFALVTAGTVASPAIVKVYSGPIFNEFSEIVGYKANGEVNLNLVPGPAHGTFNISSGVNAIYSNNNPPPGANIPTQTTISVGPIRDEFGNIVAPNSPVQVSIQNGFNVSGVVPEANSVIYTDSLGRSSFILVGANSRGHININTTIAGASASTSLWSYDQSRIKYDTTSNLVDFNFLHYDANSLPSKDVKWGTVRDPVPMGNLDSVYHGSTKYSDRVATSFSMVTEFPYFNWNCSFTGADYLVFNFCLQPSQEYSPLYKYLPNFTFELDSPQVNNLEELVLNGDFSSQNMLDFWDDFENNPQLKTGVKYSTDFTGTMWIDNSVFVDPQHPTLKKNFAVSSPIEVQDDKKYVVLFTTKSMLGTTDNSNVSVGYIKENINNIGNPNYTLPEVIILNESYSLSTVNAQQRLILLPEEGTTHIRLYFSTKGTGNQASIKLDDISMRELTTQNIHDLFSTDGVSTAFMENWDQAIMFGGFAGYETSPNQYSSQNSGQTTVMTRVLDPSIGVVINRYAEDSTTDIGDKPSARGYMSMTSSKDEIYAFGGMTLSGNGQAKDDFYIWEGANQKWRSQTILPDPNISDPNNLGYAVPGKRYQNGLLLIPELNNLYLIGGLKQDKEFESLWHSMDDIWKIDLTNPVKEWNSVCQFCNIVSENVYADVGTAWYNLTNTPNNNTLNDYVSAARNVKMINSIWHEATQKAYIFLPETNIYKSFDPYSEVIGDVPIGVGISGFRNMYNINYNPNIGRTFGYQRGEPELNNSKIFFWDMDRDEKQYVKVTFNLNEETKTFIQDLKVNLYAYGQSKTFRSEGTINENGVELYLFNHQTLEWVLVGENEASTPIGAQTPITFSVSNVMAPNYVSLDGKITALITPKGRPGFTGGDPRMGDDLEFVKLTDESGFLADIKEIYTGGQVSCGILSDDSVKCWGRNDRGQLGQGTAVASIGESPNEMSSISNIRIFDPNNPSYSGVTVKQLAVGGTHVCALLSNNEVKCWGDNTSGKLGIEVDPVDSSVAFGDGVNEMGNFLPVVRIFNPSHDYEIIKLVAGENHTCALIKVADYGTMNRVKCWGINNYGQLGNNSTTNYGGPDSMGDNLPWIAGITTFFDAGLNITRDASVKDITAGKNHNCIISESIVGTDVLKCWGRNDMGQLSTTDLSNKTIATSTTIQSIEIYKLKSGGDHNCMSYYDGSFDKFYCWGRNDYGQIGRGGGGIISSELVVNGTFSSVLANWGTIGAIAPVVQGGEASIRGGVNGLRQDFSSLKIDSTYEFSIDARQNIGGASENLLDSGINWTLRSGTGSGSGMSVNVGSTSLNEISQIRSGIIDNDIEALRNYTYRFNIQNASGQPYFKILDANFNVILASDQLSSGYHSYSFQLMGHQEFFYIEWSINQYSSATIQEMEIIKNPISSVPLNIRFFKNDGFGYEIFDLVTFNSTGTFRHEFIAPSSNIRMEIVSSSLADISEEVFVDNVSLKLKNDLIVDLPLDLNFEFINLENMNPEVSNSALLTEEYIPKNEHPNFRALHRKMLLFEPSKQERIRLENFSDTNIGTEDFMIEMEISPMDFGTRRPLLSKIGMSQISGQVTTTGGWIIYIDQNRRLVFYSSTHGIVGESQFIDTGFQKIRIQRTTEGSINRIRFYRDLGLGWRDISVNGNLSNGDPIPNIQGLNLSNNTDAPIVIGSTFDDSSLAGEQRAYGHYSGYIGYIYLKIGQDHINFIEGLLDNDNILADFTDLGGAEVPVDFDLGDFHTCVLTLDNDVKCFGQNTGGQLGYGHGVDEYGIFLEHMGYNIKAVDLGSTPEIISISSGAEFNCALFIDGTSKCWGRNALGQLGIESTENHGRGRDNVRGTNELKVDYIDIEGIF